MTTRDLFEETYSAVTVNKVRSGLTMLGIVIGIASVIALVAVGQGSQASIQANIDSLGANLVMVTPGAARTFGTTVRSAAGSSQTLTPDDEAAIASVNNVAAIAPEISGRYQVIYKANNSNTSVLGTTAAYLQVRNVAIDTGKFYHRHRQCRFKSNCGYRPHGVAGSFCAERQRKCNARYGDRANYSDKRC